MLVFNFRDKIIVHTPKGPVEGFVYHAPPGRKEIYVVLTGGNGMPVMVHTSTCEKIPEPEEVKRGRGRPRIKPKLEEPK